MVLLTRLPTKVMVSPRMIDAAITNWLARLKRRKGAHTFCHPGRREFDVGAGLGPGAPWLAFSGKADDGDARLANMAIRATPECSCIGATKHRHVTA
ncbi:hypothetical protein D3C84_1084420 [compost metagenome]